MSSSGKSSKGGGAGKMPAMPQAPYYGASMGEMEDYNKYQQGLAKYQKKNKKGFKLAGSDAGEIEQSYLKKMGLDAAPERPGAFFDSAMKENFQKAWSPDAGKEYTETLFNQMREPITQDMYGRGLGSGSEINDTAMMKAKMAALLGAHQMVGQDRSQSLGLTDRGYQASTLPYMTAVDWAKGQAAMEQAAKDRESSKKGNTLTNATNLGVQGIATFGSDIRLKENIKPVSEGINGLTVYEFNYNWSPVKYRGYMAQEIEMVDPSHVFDNNGIKMVSEKYAPEVIH